MIKYLGKTTTQTADLIMSNVLWNSVLSIALAKFMCVDIKKMLVRTDVKV